MSTNWSTLLFFELNSEKSDYFSIWGKIYPCQINSNLCVVGKKKVFIHACTGNFFILTALRICFHPPCNQILKIGFQLTQCILPLSFLVIGFTFGALTRHWGLDQETRREGWRSHIPLHLLPQASHWRHCCFVRHILRACIGWSFFFWAGEWAGELWGLSSPARSLPCGLRMMEIAGARGSGPLWCWALRLCPGFHGSHFPTHWLQRSMSQAPFPEATMSKCCFWFFEIVPPNPR